MGLSVSCVFKHKFNQNKSHRCSHSPDVTVSVLQNAQDSEIFLECNLLDRLIL